MSKRFFLSLLMASSLLVAACGGGSSSSSSTVGPRLKNSALPVCETPTETTVSEVVEEGPLADVNCVEAGDEAEETAPIVDAPLAGASEEEDESKNSTPESQPDQTKTTSAPKPKSATDPTGGVFATPPADTSKRTPSGTTTKLNVVGFKESTLVPNDLCKILGVTCASLNFVNVTTTGPNAFTASAEIPKTAFAFPGMTISNTRLTVAVEGAAATFAVQADAEAVMFGSQVPMTLTGTFNTEDVSISLTLGNKELGLNDVFGIPGLSISSISTQVKIIGVAPTCCLFSMTGTLPTFLKELGINPQTAIRVTASMGSYPYILGMSVGSQDPGSADIFSIKNVLSAKYIAASLSVLPAQIDGVSYPQGLAMAFDGMFGNTPVTVEGNLVNPYEWSLDFNIGAFSVGGFQLDETVGSISKTKTELGLMINGGIKGYGLEARLKGSFDVFGGLVLEGESSFKPGAGIDLGTIKLKMGAKFTKWRAVIKIGDGMPTDECIDLNMKALADYAKLVQDNGMVPIVEPEVLMDGSHSIDDCYAATERSLQSLFNHLNKNDVNIKATLLKPNMVLSGSAATSQAGVEEVAQKTLDCLKANVPADLAGITFLSGGQSDIDATAHLDAMNKIGGFSWKLSFSYGRALQAPALKAWGGKPENAFISQDALSHRAEMNKLAALGKWDNGMEED